MTLADRIPGWRRVRRVFRRETLGKDAVAGTILGIVSVPDGLAAGLLAGLNPIAGLYGYLFGIAGGALFTSSTFMAVQATSAMSIVIADSDIGAARSCRGGLHARTSDRRRHDPRRTAPRRAPAAVRAHGRDGRLRHRDRRQHRARPAAASVRRRRLRRQPPRPEHRPAHPSRSGSSGRRSWSAS